MGRWAIIGLFVLACLKTASQNTDSFKIAFLGLNAFIKADWLNNLSKANRWHQPDKGEMFAVRALDESKLIKYMDGMASSYNNLAWIEWFRKRNYLKMQDYCIRTIALANSITKKDRLAEAYFLLGCTLWAQCKYDLSIDAYTEAGRLSMELGDELGLANTYAYKASVEEGRGNYGKSLYYSQKWLAIAKKHPSSRYYDIWGDLYKNIGDYQTALEYYRQAEKQAKKGVVYDDIHYFTSGIGELFLLQKQFDSARYYFQLASSIEPKNFFANPPRWSELYLAQRKYDSAFMILNAALLQCRKSSGRGTMMWALLRLGNAYKEVGAAQSAVLSAQELLQTALQVGARQYVRDAHYLLYQLSEKRGEREGAYHHLQQYTLLKDSIDRDLSIQQLAFHKLKSEKEKSQFRIDLLNREKLLQEQRLRQTSLQRNFLTVGILALIIIAMVVLRNLYLKRKNEAHRRSLAENELEMQRLENEKTRVEFRHRATELEMQALRAQMSPHFIFNSLNSINGFVLRNDKIQASEYLTKFSRLMRLILQNSQSAFISLQNELDALRLYLELEALRFNYHFNYKIIIGENVDPLSLKVPPLIIQPYVENAIWHGLMHKEEQGNLEIKIDRKENSLCVQVLDDGVGREKASKTNHSATTYKPMGMRITADRIVLLQEKIQSEASIKVTDLVLPDGKATGTEVLLEIPVLYD